MSIIRRIKRKNKQTGKDEVMDLGALGSNIVQDATHRFVTDTEKTAWNGKVDASGGDISSTKVSTITDSSESFPVPAAGDQTKTWLGKIKKWQQDCLAKFGNYLLTSMIANQHQNNTGTVPSSALAYLMQQAIVANQNSIGVLNTKLAAGLMARVAKCYKTVSVPANGFTGSQMLDITPPAGYTAVGIVGIQTDYPATVIPTMYYLNKGNQIAFTLKSTYGAELSCAAIIHVLYLPASWNIAVND